MKRRRFLASTLGAVGTLGVWSTLELACSKAASPVRSDAAPSSATSSAEEIGPSPDAGGALPSAHPRGLVLRQSSPGGARIEIDAPRPVGRPHDEDPAASILIIMIGVAARVAPLSELKPTVLRAKDTSSPGRYHASVDLGPSLAAVRGAAPVLVHACSGAWLSGTIAVAS